MKRLALQLVIGMVTFVAGAEFHQLVVRLAERAIGYTIVFEGPETATIDSLETESPLFNRSAILISMDDKRDIYLGKKLIGSPADTNELPAKFRIEFARFAQTRMSCQPRELSEPICLAVDYNDVIIRASVRCSYGDVVRLMEAVRSAGANRIGLVADWPKYKLRCLGRFLWDGFRFRCYGMAVSRFNIDTECRGFVAPTN
ncbi:MAG: hypothetical protein JWM21_380 [Acidobacteria bacterium]|nr:hypothetical protein [Acidobacteriota bacterium]